MEVFEAKFRPIEQSINAMSIVQLTSKPLVFILNAGSTSNLNLQGSTSNLNLQGSTSNLNSSSSFHNSREELPPPYDNPSNNEPTNTLARSSSGRIPPPVPRKSFTSCWAIAIYDFDAIEETDLSFKANDRIEVLKKTDAGNDWWTGRLNGKTGVFPSNYVKEI
jgi:amphiphysin